MLWWLKSTKYYSVIVHWMDENADASIFEPPPENWILGYMRLEIWCRSGLSADWCCCTALHTRSAACYCWIGLSSPAIHFEITNVNVASHAVCDCVCAWFVSLVCTPWSKKGTTFLFSFNTQCNLTKFSILIVNQGGLVAEWLACWTQAQKGLGSNHSCDAVG